MAEVLLTCRRRSKRQGLNLSHVSLRVGRYEVVAVHGYTMSGPAPSFIPLAAQRFDKAARTDLNGLVDADGISFVPEEVAKFIRELEGSDIDQAEDVDWLIEEIA